MNTTMIPINIHVNSYEVAEWTIFSRPGVLTRELLGSIQKGNRSYKIDELLFASTIVIRPKNDFEVHVDDGTEDRDHVRKIIESEYLKTLELVEKMSRSME